MFPKKVPYQNTFPFSVHNLLFNFYIHKNIIPLSPKFLISFYIPHVLYLFPLLISKYTPYRYHSLGSSVNQFACYSDPREMRKICISFRKEKWFFIAKVVFTVWWISRMIYTLFYWDPHSFYNLGSLFLSLLHIHTHTKNFFLANNHTSHTHTHSFM